MVTFLGLLAVLISVNVILLAFNAIRSSKVVKESMKTLSNASTKIYPIDLNTAKYKKAV
ncbi:hypothetical protein [Spongiimicrobium salis]|uniref:hypothetical protein n=1 Tax=Spongiimicrobium salis TaxID=1667022 RepID=UPI00374D2E68